MAKTGDQNMGDAVAAHLIAASRGESGGQPPIEVTLVDEAAIQITHLSEMTGKSVDQLIGVSIRLLLILFEAQAMGRKLVISTRNLWPIKEIFL
jgi:hypothetical protein